jgi:hypothetical protein
MSDNNKQFQVGWNAGINKAVEQLELMEHSPQHTPEQRDLCARCRNIAWLKSQIIEIEIETRELETLREWKRQALAVIGGALPSRFQGHPVADKIAYLYRVETALAESRAAAAEQKGVAYTEAESLRKLLTMERKQLAAAQGALRECTARHCECACHSVALAGKPLEPNRLAKLESALEAMALRYEQNKGEYGGYGIADEIRGILRDCEAVDSKKNEPQGFARLVDNHKMHHTGPMESCTRCTNYWHVCATVAAGKHTYERRAADLGCRDCLAIEAGEQEGKE